jgi:hypothetical protein
MFWQDHNDGPSESRPLPIIKTKSHCYSTARNELAVNLTPEETLRFSDERKAYRQLSGVTVDGTRFLSQEEMFTVYPAKDEIVDDDDIILPPEDDGFVILDGGHI